MGRRSRRRSISNWWTQSTGGMAHWLAVAIVAVLGASVLGVGLIYAQRDTSPATAYTPPPDTASSDPTPTAERDVLAIIGDSWTNGSIADSPSTAYTAQTAKALGADLVALGVGGTGYTASNERGGVFGTRVDAAVEAGADIVVVQGSSNDYAATEQEIYDAAVDVFTRLREGLPAARIYALGMMHSPSSPVQADETSLRAVSAAAEETGVTFIDGNAEPWLVVPDDFADGYHPNQRGHDKVAENLVAAIRQTP